LPINARLFCATLALSAALLAGCANPAFIDPIEGRTFIVENHTRQTVWDAAVAALKAGGSVEAEKFDRGELRGYAGTGSGLSAILITLNQLYPGEDVYTVSVAGKPVAPFGESDPTRDALIAAMQEKLAR